MFVFFIIRKLIYHMCVKDLQKCNKKLIENWLFEEEYLNVIHFLQVCQTCKLHLNHIPPSLSRSLKFIDT